MNTWHILCFFTTTPLNLCYVIVYLEYEEMFVILQEKQQLPDMEFGRRLAADRDLSHTDAFSLCNISKRNTSPTDLFLQQNWWNWIKITALHSSAYFKHTICLIIIGLLILRNDLIFVS